MAGFAAKALLFDLDGTLINSIIAVERAWGDWAKSVGINNFTFEGKYHGVQRPDIIADLLPHISASEIDEHAETIRVAEAKDTDGVIALPGSHAFLTSLPAASWAIVTACDYETAEARLNATGLPIPKVLINADMLQRGKPDPQGYLLGASHLGIQPEDCIVFEDAPAGLEAAQRANMRSVALRTTAANDEVLHSAQIIIDDLSTGSVLVTSNGIQLKFS